MRPTFAQCGWPWCRKCPHRHATGLACHLITHTSRRLRNCADRLARDTMGDDEDGETVAEETPLRPNPVTQDEMDAGSIELF